MMLIHNNESPTGYRIAASALAALGAASAIPIPLAQLDFAGLFNAFNIDHGDAPDALLVVAAVGGTLTFAVLALAFAGAVLAFTGAPSARNILIAERSEVWSPRCRSGSRPAFSSAQPRCYSATSRNPARQIVTEIGTHCPPAA
jgi:hypothetical protein